MRRSRWLRFPQGGRRLRDVRRRTIRLRHSDADRGASKRTCSLRLACFRKTCQVLSWVRTGDITLKAETARPPRSSLPAQQRAFDVFRRRYNEQRPHEALAYETPVSRYQPSPRPYPPRLAHPEYPPHFRVQQAGHDDARDHDRPMKRPFWLAVTLPWSFTMSSGTSSAAALVGIAATRTADAGFTQCSAFAEYS